jgi:hypothetical protein
MYLKATIQKVTDFGYFANFGREQTFEQSKICDGKKKSIVEPNLSLNCQALVRVLARYFRDF